MTRPRIKSAAAAGPHFSRVTPSGAIRAEMNSSLTFAAPPSTARRESLNIIRNIEYGAVIAVTHWAWIGRLQVQSAQAADARAGASDVISDPRARTFFSLFWPT